MYFNSKRFTPFWSLSELKVSWFKFLSFIYQECIIEMICSGEISYTISFSKFKVLENDKKIKNKNRVIDHITLYLTRLIFFHFVFKRSLIAKSYIRREKQTESGKSLIKKR